MIVDKRIPLEQSKKVFFTSDTHFYHSSIIKFCKRPFANVKEMNEALIERWNEKVPEDGLVFHLGDFAWGSAQNWREMRSRLHGDIILILGNHDMKNAPLTKTQFGNLFTEFHQQMLIRITGENGKRYVYLNHYPMLCYAGTYKPDNAKIYQLFGHVHMTHEKAMGLDTDLVLNNCWPSQYDVGVDFNDYAPISWDEVDAKIQYQLQNHVNLSHAVYEPEKKEENESSDNS